MEFFRSQIFISLISGIGSLLVGLITVPMFRKAAKQWNIVDHPDGKLKTHLRVTPYLGGLAIYLAVLITISFTMDFDKRLMGVLLGSTVIILVGLIDDFHALTAGQKLAGQILAVTIAVKSGIYIQKDAIPLFLHIPVTYIWILGLINAVNLIDGIDGQAAGISFIVFIFFSILSFMNGDYHLMIFSSSMAGAVLAFLFFNFHPASIFLGDTGSMFLGLLLGVISIMVDYKGPNKLTIFIPIFVLSLPIFNMVYVMSVRVIHGINPFKGTLDHWHDNLKSLGLSVIKVSILSWTVTLVLSILSFSFFYLSFFITLIIQTSILFLFGLLAIWFISRRKLVQKS